MELQNKFQKTSPPPSLPPQGGGKIVLLIILILSIISTTALAKKRTKPKETYIPPEVITSLKLGDINSAARALMLGADTDREQYLLNEMVRIRKFEKLDKYEKKDPKNIFNTGIAYHNLFLFLKGRGISNEDLAKDALKYYQKALKTKSPSRKNNINITMAALYSSMGNTKRAEKIFKKADPELIEPTYQKYLTLALYYAAAGDTVKAAVNLEAAYEQNPKYTKFWIEVSDDFDDVSEDDELLKLFEKWGIKPRKKDSSS